MNVMTGRGYQELLKSRDDLEKLLKKLIDERNEHGGKGSYNDGESDVMLDFNQQEATLVARLKPVLDRLRTTTVAKAPTSTKTLQVGHEAEIEIVGEAGKKTQVFFIGGHLEHSLETTPHTISCVAPLIAGLIGMPVGSTDEVSINGKEVLVRLTRISLPGKAQPERQVA